ncbi:MAG: hypothetical protein M1553_07715 [Firmicutes bacterium]|nr:hypothetical protein [Bacillota bacterium]
MKLSPLAKLDKEEKGVKDDEKDCSSKKTGIEFGCHVASPFGSGGLLRV